MSSTESANNQNQEANDAKDALLARCRTALDVVLAERPSLATLSVGAVSLQELRDTLYTESEGINWRAKAYELDVQRQRLAAHNQALREGLMQLDARLQVILADSAMTGAF